MKILYIGAQKSGKSRLAELKTLELAAGRLPVYLATYDNSYADTEMARRLEAHRKRRKGRFETVEEPLFIDRVVQKEGIYLIDCLSMWILNLLEAKIDHEAVLERLLQKEADMVFVLNSVGSGIVPPDPLSRNYVDLSGAVGQQVAAACDVVYEVTVGLERRLK